MIFKTAKKPENFSKLLREVIIDIYFVPENNETAIELDIITELKKIGFGNLERLDVPTIPKELKDKYKAFDYYPQYNLKKDEYSVCVGSNILSLSIGEKYESWNNVSLMVKNIVKTLKNVMFEVSQVRVNYINTTTDVSFLQKLMLNSEVDSIVNDVKKSFSNVLFYSNETYSIVLSLSNNVKVKVSKDDATYNKGSLVDIKAIAKSCTKDKIYDMINEMHEDIEYCYFGLLNKIG